MKLICILALGLMTASAVANTYSEEDFIKKVNEEVKKKVDDIKNKSVSDLTKELLDKEEKLKLRELELQKQQDALRVSEGEIAKRYAELSEKQRKFIGCVEKNEDESKARI